MGALTAYGQATPVAETTIAADIHEPLDVHIHFRSQLTFNLVFIGDDITDRHHLLLGKVAHRGVEGHLGFSENLTGTRMADTVDMRQRILHRFIAGQIYPGNSSHKLSSFLHLTGHYQPWRCL